MESAWFRRKLVDIIPMRSTQHFKTINDIVFDQAKKIIEENKAALERGDQEMLHMVGEGKDIISIMRNLCQSAPSAADEDKLMDDELFAQVMLRKELVEAREQYESMIHYDELSQLPYLDAVCRETLRLYASIKMVGRLY
ncbi:hypothetical protein C8Q80DRAFT_1297541 [Daedaleopsis nitida]|nr:hypothetical protein C8Q80DRAFT_1297541 [Daedaleopsis nitida]